MTNVTPQGRRRHGACLLSLREYCPFRKLKKSKCSATSEAVGARWANACDKSGVYSERYAQSAPTLPLYRPDQREENTGPTPMEAEAAGSASSAANLINLHQNSLSSSDMSMDLDSAVDPETGERAQG